MGLITVVGSIGDIVGTIVTSSEPEERSLRVRASPGAIYTGIDLRDSHLKTRNYFDVQRFPEITFQAIRIDELGPHVRVRGTLVARGVANEIDVEATTVPIVRALPSAKGAAPISAAAGAQSNERLHYETRFVIDRRTFAIGTGGRTGRNTWHPADSLIGRMARVHVVLEGVPIG
jgi:polyisoprenoid-binding protein YceI